MTTKGKCLLSKSNILEGPQSWEMSLDNKDFSPDKSAARPPRKKRWMRAASTAYWAVTIIFCLRILAVSGILLIFGIDSLKSRNKPTTFPALWNLGFGTATSYTVVQPFNNPNNESGIIPMVILANSPQILILIAYFLYNNILTSMLLAAEYDDYARQRKPLRVSWPKGLQRSSYYLSLPYRYSIPLLVTYTVLHWLVSQSLFFMEVLPFDVYGNQVSTKRQIMCGYSPIAIIMAMFLEFLMVCTLLGLGMRRFKSNMPLAVSCSAAISAACHPPPGDEHALKPVMWGEIPVENINHSRRTSSEPDNEEATSRPGFSLDTRSREPDGEDSSSDRSQREGQEIRAHLLTGSNGPDENCAVYGHCRFSSLEVITPNSLRFYA